MLLDEWEHACSQPRGVQLGAWLRHQREEELEYLGQTKIGCAVTGGKANTKSYEELAELQGAVPANLRVDEEGANEARRNFPYPQFNKLKTMR